MRENMSKIEILYHGMKNLPIFALAYLCFGQGIILGLQGYTGAIYSAIFFGFLLIVYAFLGLIVRARERKSKK